MTMIGFRAIVSGTTAALILLLSAASSYAVPQPGLDVDPFEFNRQVQDVSTPQRAALPSRCRVTLRGATGERAAYASACLDDHFSQSGALPASCESVLETGSGPRGFFGAECLSEAGWALR